MLASRQSWCCPGPQAWAYREKTQTLARVRRSSSPTAHPVSPRRRCTNWLRAPRRINAPVGSVRREERRSEWGRRPNRQIASLPPCAPGASRHLACGASADTAHRNGSSDTRPGLPDDTLPTATAASGVDEAAVAGATPRSQASVMRRVEAVADRQTRPPPAGLHPNPPQAATSLRQLRLVANTRERFRGQSSNYGRSPAAPNPAQISIEELL